MYDNIEAIDAGQAARTEPVVYRFEDLGICDNVAKEVGHKQRLLSENNNDNNAEIFEQILKQVDRATSQAEQLEKLDCEVSYSVFDRDLATRKTTATTAAVTGLATERVDSVVADAVEFSGTEFIPFYQVSEELIIEESYNVKKKSSRGTFWMIWQCCLGLSRKNY